MTQDIRWKQRFLNFEKAFNRLQEALSKNELSELELNGLIQRFEFTIELCWNTLKDYMQEEGFDFKPTPKETIRTAFKANLVEDAQVLIDAISLRNELSHNYDDELLKQSEKFIREKAAPTIQKIYGWLKIRFIENK